jgi:hypothetical protein
MARPGIRLNLGLSALSLTALLLASPNLSAQTTTQDGKYQLAGQCADVIAKYMATSSGVTIQTNGFGPQATGNITLSLDTSHTSQATFDFTHGTETWDLYLTLNSQLQQANSLAPIPIHLVETGNIAPFNLTNTGSLAWTATHNADFSQPPNDPHSTGSDAITFANPTGTTLDLAFSNNTPLAGSYSINTTVFQALMTDNITLQAGSQQLQEGSNFTISSVPEAGTLSIAMLGVTGIGVLARRRQTRRIA